MHNIRNDSVATKELHINEDNYSRNSVLQNKLILQKTFCEMALYDFDIQF